MVKIKVKNVNSQIDGFIPTEAYNDLVDALAYQVKGAEFSEKYMSGQWDGYKRLFNKNKRTFFSGLLGNAIEVFQKHNIYYEIEDLRVRPKVSKIYNLKNEIDGEPLIPRDYQLEAVQKALIYGRGLIEIATGGGKSLVITILLARLGLPSVVFVNTKDLLYQMLDDLRFIDTNEDIIGQIGDGIVEPRLFTVCTIQSVYQALGVRYPKFDEEDLMDEPLTEDKKDIVINTVRQASVMVIDETQFLASDTFQLTASNCINAYYRYGLSATPTRTDNAALMLTAATGKKFFVKSASDLIDEGRLIAPDITMVAVPKENGSGSTAYQTIYKEKIAENEISNNIIVDIGTFFYERNMSVLILVNHISHGEILLSKLKTTIDTEIVEEIKTGKSKKRIKNIEFLKGNVDSEKRKRIIALIKKKEIKILVATTLADCGLNIPSLDVLILAGRGNSIVRIPQRIGRVIRKNKNKKRAFVFDFFDHVKYFNTQAKERKRIYESERAFKIHHFKPNSKITLQQYLKNLVA